MRIDVDNDAVSVVEFPEYCGNSLRLLAEPPLPVFQSRLTCDGNIVLGDDGNWLVMYRDGGRKLWLTDIQTKRTQTFEVPEHFEVENVGGRLLRVNFRTAIDLRQGAVLTFQGNDPQLAHYPSRSDVLDQAEKSEEPVLLKRNFYADPERAWLKGADIFTDPETGREIYLVAGTRRPSVTPEKDPIRFFLDTLEPAQPPGPSQTALAGSLAAGQFVKSCTEGWCSVTAQSGNGRYAIWSFASGGLNPQSVGVFETGNPLPLWILPLKEGSPRMGFDDDSRHVVIHTGQKERTLYDVRSGNPVRVDAVETRRELGSPSKKRPVGLQDVVVLGSPYTGEDQQGGLYAWLSGLSGEKGTLRVAVAESGEIIFKKPLEEPTFAESSYRTGAVSISAQTRRVASLSTDGKVRIFSF